MIKNVDGPSVEPPSFIAEFFNMSILFWFFLVFLREIGQPNGLKSMKNILLTKKKNQKNFQDNTLTNFPEQNQVWQIVCTVASRDTWFRIFAIDIPDDWYFNMTVEWKTKDNQWYIPYWQRQILRSFSYVLVSCVIITIASLQRLGSKHGTQNCGCCYGSAHGLWDYFYGWTSNHIYLKNKYWRDNRPFNFSIGAMYFCWKSVEHF